MNNLNVLYVNENEINAVSINNLLKKVFKNITVSNDGSKALKLFKQFNHQLVITDMRTPNIDGFVLSEQILNIQPITKIIIMSEFNINNSYHTYTNLKIFKYIQKPINLSDFENTLHAVIREIN